MSWLKDTGRGVELTLRVIPGARKNSVEGEYGDALKVRLTAPPLEGKANAALVAFLADQLAVPKGRIRIVSGATSRNKRVHVQELTAAAAVRALLLQG